MTLSHSKPCLLALFLCLLGCVSALSVPAKRETNAERLAQGLAPLRPSFSRRTTGTYPARRAVASPLPPVTVNGRLQVRSSTDGDVYGFVRNWSGGAPISGINFLSGFEPDLEVTITYSPSSPERLNIVVTNPAFAAPYYVGAAGGTTISGPTTLDPSVRSILGFTNVGRTLPGDTPAVIPPSTSYVESAIWSYDSATGRLRAIWVNPDSTTIEAQLAWDLRANALLFVSNVTAYNAASTFPVAAGDLFLV